MIAMNLTDDLKPRLWGLGVLPSPDPISLDDPLAKRTLRYWPAFMGLNTKNVPLLDRINDSAEGRIAMAQEIQETRRLLYVVTHAPTRRTIITWRAKTVTAGWRRWRLTGCCPAVTRSRYPMAARGPQRLC
ncbi:MAG: hypothetical protein IPG06_22215 [Haliea sp.]|nr:hypothetical protein [Haliea sp.]